jgi:hypothetical protein
MYSANDLAKAYLAVRREMIRQFEAHDHNTYPHGVNWSFQKIAKAALDAQYLPAQTPPSDGSKKCMIYGHERTIVD